MSGGEGKVVCVTGGSGYIASWLVKFLLQGGYTVKTTVRYPNDPKKTEHLLALDGAKERLHLFKANLLEEGSFDAVVNGCVGVFHTASPVTFTATDPQTEIIDPAVKGTLNVLKSCAKVPSIKRVIFTSSLATCIYSGQPLNRDVTIDENWYSDPAICKELGAWYPLAKTLAEEAARNFAKENAIDLVVLNPAFVIGPLLQPTLCLSVEMILGLVNGSQTYPNANYRCIDVRDVARAHIQAFEIPSASGRYCLVGTVTEFDKVLKIILELYPTLQPPENKEARETYFSSYGVSKERSERLGINMFPLEETLRDTIESLKEKGFLKI